MGPFLQAAFGAPRTSFVFVMRHPLVWALAIEKWIQPEFGALRVAEAPGSSDAATKITSLHQASSRPQSSRRVVESA